MGEHRRLQTCVSDVIDRVKLFDAVGTVLGKAFGKIFEGIREGILLPADLVALHDTLEIDETVLPYWVHFKHLPVIVES